MKCIKGIIILVIYLGGCISAQTDSLAERGESIMEGLLSDTESEEKDYSELIEELSDSPLDLNEANISDLQKIPFINAADAAMIIKHRNKYGRFFSVNELLTVDGITKTLAEAVIPFVKVSGETSSAGEEIDEGNTITRYQIKSRSRVITDLQERKGFSENKYNGSQLRIYNRLNVSYTHNFEAGILTEKDAGESSFYDFNSYYFTGKDIFGLKNFIAGDYRIEAGQGLVFWSPYGISKSSGTAATVKKKGRGIIPYRSTDENNYFRGTSIAADFNRFSAVLFYSKNRFDAIVIEGSNIISSTVQDGLHRTANELNRRKSAVKQTAGGIMSYDLADIAGLSFIYSRSEYSHSFNKQVISGKKIFNIASLAYDIYAGEINISGETAYNGTTAASINNLFIPAGRSLRLVTSVRIYPYEFFSPDGNSFSDRGSVSNETGFYTGLQLKTSAGEVNLFYDHFKHPAATSILFPSEGSEWSLHYKYKAGKTLTVLSYRNGLREDKIAGGLITRKLKQNYYIDFTLRPDKYVQIKSRCAYKNVFVKSSGSISEGYLFFQDFNFNPSGNLKTYARVILFRTDDFESALYEYENDAEGIFRGYALYGEGIRWYILLKYKLLNKAVFSFKYSETYKPHERTTGTGDALIQGNLDNSVIFQVDILF